MQRIVAGWIACLAILLGASAPAQAGGVMSLRVAGIIDPASADFIVRGLARAAAEEAELVVIEMDTPGGLDTAMRQIIKAILASPVPVATYVPRGRTRRQCRHLHPLRQPHRRDVAGDQSRRRHAGGDRHARWRQGAAGQGARGPAAKGDEKPAATPPPRRWRRHGAQGDQRCRGLSEEPGRVARPQPRVRRACGARGGQPVRRGGPARRRDRSHRHRRQGSPEAGRRAPRHHQRRRAGAGHPRGGNRDRTARLAQSPARGAGESAARGDPHDDRGVRPVRGVHQPGLRGSRVAGRSA